MARPKGSFSTPNYRHHKPSGQAVVSICGRDYYLGEYGSRESKQKYDRLIGEWLVRGKQGPEASDHDTVTIAQISAAYMEYATGYYRATFPHAITSAVRILNRYYGDTAAKDFSATSVEALRRHMMKAPANRGGKANKDTLSRNYINDLMGRLRKMFRWAAARRMIPTSIAFEVTSIEPLRRGRCDARETEKVKPVPTRDLNAVLDVAPPHLADMIRLQLLTGARPGEICTMRTCDLDTSRPVWKYTPAAHKTDYAGFERPIFIGPQAQEILTPRLKADLQASIFNPWDAYAAAREAARKASKSRHLKPLKPKGSCGRIKNDRYTVMVYWHMVNRACQLADRLAHENRPDVPADVVLVNPWHPHQLRHNAATLLRKAYGLDVAKAVLGHQNTSVTEIYAEQDYEKAQDAIAKLG